MVKKKKVNTMNPQRTLQIQNKRIHIFNENIHNIY